MSTSERAANVYFGEGARGKGENCLCSACHGEGRVIPLRLPDSLYYDGNHLSTRYSEYWLCEECAKKLHDTLIHGMKERGWRYDNG